MTTAGGGGGGSGGGSVTGLGLALEDGRDLQTSLTGAKLSQGSVTPPRLNSYPVSAREAYTPDRGSHLPAPRHLDNGTSDYGDGSPLPLSRMRTGVFGSSTFSDGVQGSPSSLPSSASAYLDENRPLITPAPRRQELRLAPPSTAQVPSKYMPASSPAPFWKYVDFGSTPAKPVPDISPTKTDRVARQGNRTPPPPTGFVDIESPSKSGVDKVLDDKTEEDNVSDGDEPLDGMSGGIDLARYVCLNIVSAAVQ